MSTRLPVWYNAMNGGVVPRHTLPRKHMRKLTMAGGSCAHSMAKNYLALIKRMSGKSVLPLAWNHKHITPTFRIQQENFCVPDRKRERAACSAARR